MHFAYRNDLASPHYLEDGELGYFDGQWWLRVPGSGQPFLLVGGSESPGGVVVTREVDGQMLFTILQRFVYRELGQTVYGVLIDSEWHTVSHGGLHKLIEEPERLRLDRHDVGALIGHLDEVGDFGISPGAEHAIAKAIKVAGEDPGGFAASVLEKRLDRRKAGEKQYGNERYEVTKVLKQFEAGNPIPAMNFLREFMASGKRAFTREEFEGHIAQAHADGFDDPHGTDGGGAVVGAGSNHYASGYSTGHYD